VAADLPNVQNPMPRSLFRLSVTAAALAIAAAGAWGAAKRPNILFVMSDDHATHAISAYGSKLITTPGIDRIAAEGMLLENCFAVNAICTPSRAAILTGKYGHKTGVTTFNTFDGSQWTVVKELQRAGYHTGVIGKWHLGGEPAGFDRWEILDGQGSYQDSEFITPTGRRVLPGYVTDVITDRALAFLDERPKDQPFLLLYHHKAPHRWWVPSEKHRREFANRRFPEPRTFNDDYSGRSDAAAEATMRMVPHLLPRDVKEKPPEGLSEPELKSWHYQRYMQDYLACVASLDENLRRVLDYLDAHGLRDNTIVIYTSDQGFFLGDHGWYDKRFMYEQSLRMPFVIRYPGQIKPGTRSDAMTLNIDFAATLLDFAGVESRGHEMQGRSFASILRGRKPRDWRTSMYYRYYHYPAHHRVQPHWGVRDERYKLIYFNRIDQWELFDLKQDPDEMRNVYADPSYAAVRARLAAELERLRVQFDDRNQYADIQQDDP
jgi:arylsulfatase A-like enzyme